jgi:hypothetical protein
VVTAGRRRPGPLDLSAIRIERLSTKRPEAVGPRKATPGCCVPRLSLPPPPIRVKPTPFCVQSPVLTNQDAEVHAGTTVPLFAQLMEADDLRKLHPQPLGGLDGPRSLCDHYRRANTDASVKVDNVLIVHADATV